MDREGDRSHGGRRCRVITSSTLPPVPTSQSATPGHAPSPGHGIDTNSLDTRASGGVRNAYLRNCRDRGKLTRRIKMRPHPVRKARWTLASWRAVFLMLAAFGLPRVAHGAVCNGAFDILQ